MTDADRSFPGYGHRVAPAEKERWREIMSARAQEAFRHGQEGLSEGRISEGLFWLGRAERLSGDSPNVVFSYAVAALSAGLLDDALTRMRRLREDFALREAAFAEVVCLSTLGREPEAIERIGQVLAGNHATAELYELIALLARAAGKAGWCTLSNDGRLRVETKRQVSLFLDGEKIGEGAEGVYALPEHWARCRSLSVKDGRRHILGSPVDIAALTRCESLVTPRSDGLEGWIWYPGDPDFHPSVRLEGGEVFRAEEYSVEGEGQSPLAQARRFHLPPAVLPLKKGPVALYDDHGRMLTGAPVEPRLGRLLSGEEPYSVGFWPIPVRPRPERKSKRRARAPGCAVVVPVYRHKALTLACLTSVLETVPAETLVIVVDDATPEPALARALDDLAAENRIVLLRNARNRGFPFSANQGMRRAENRDVLLLNSDTVVFAGWVERLRRWLSLPDVGTVTPFSNAASIFSYPSADKVNDAPDARQGRLLDGMFQKASDGQTPVEVPTANGFCMGIAAECLAETGFFREDLFAQGYGEENEFCLRATALGFRHLVATDVYVVHAGSASFGGGASPLLTRNQNILNALRPGYARSVAAFIRRDPLGPLRRRVDQLRLERWVGRRSSVLMIQHDAGGGVGRAVRERARLLAQEGVTALSLRPSPEGCVLEPVIGAPEYPNLVFALPEEGFLLISVLKKLRVRKIEWHHLVGHAPWVRKLHQRLGVPYDVYIHDHVWFCPRIALLDGEGRYCGEPEISGCQACVERWGSALDEEIGVPELVERSRDELAAAERCIAPSQDAARRLHRHIEGLAIAVAPLEDDQALLAASPGKAPGAVRRICIVGGISRWKGYDVLLALAQHVRAHRLPLEFVLVGHTLDDAALIDAGVRITGEYREEEALALIERQKADLGFIPSVAPETWCYALGWLWRAGLEAMSFDIGASAERIRHAKRGMVLPLGLPVHRLAEILMSYTAGNKAN